MQTQELTGTTTPTIRKSPSLLSAIINCVPIGTTTDHVSGPRDVSREKMTQAHMSHRHAQSYLRNAGLNTINTPTLNLHDLSSLCSFLFSPTYFSFSHSHSPKPLAPQSHHSVSEEVPDPIHVRKPLQSLFRPYPKLTPHLHPYLCLQLNNLYYDIKSTFDMSTNLTLHCKHKPTFWHCRS